MDEQHVEAKLDDDSECRYIPVAEVGLSIVLARVHRSVDFRWIGTLSIVSLPVSGYGGLSGGRCWSVGTSGESSARLWAFRAWSVCRCGSLGR